ncbi:MAG: cell division protein FtsZ [Flammeovirgaceae bacterium]|nr:cell division protein FtsZ [Flammeovirgaceae bacterium]
MFESGSSYRFDLPKQHKSIIKVIGVGGGGSNAVNHMYRLGIKDVEFVVCNTDVQALNSSPVPNKLQIGIDLTEGLGCGANPRVGRAAAIESKEQITECLESTKMVFITAGMGGGTGTGAAPVIAKIAKGLGILTVGIVTVPFAFEGKKKYGLAEKGVRAMRRSCDTVLVIVNDKLRAMYGNLAIGQAFSEADDVLTTAAKGIAEIITLAGYVNVDFQDVRTVMRNAGAAVMGSAERSGEDRAIKVAKEALSSPLLDNRDIMGAKKILLSIISGEEAELQMDELTQISEYIQEQAGTEAEVIFGHGIDPSLGERIRVTVIATGFVGETPEDDEPPMEKKKVLDLERDTQASDEADNSVNESTKEPALKNSLESEPSEADDLDDEPEISKPRIELEITNENPIEFDEPDEDLFEEEKKKLVYTLPLFEEKSNPVNRWEDEDEEEEDNFFNDLDAEEEEIESPKAISEDKLEASRTKERLHQQAEERRLKLKEAKKREMTKEEFNEKWTLPAYLRKGVKIEDTPQSSEPYISRYSLTDDKGILGNNKFLHDNVD